MCPVRDEADAEPCGRQLRVEISMTSGGVV